MTPSVSQVVRWSVAGVAALAATVGPVAASYADSVAYHDQYAHGYVGLCDAHGHNLTHGSVYDKPFVWRAVSSVPAAPSLRGAGHKATLVAYQPRPGIDPQEWSGDALTASTAYTNVSTPMAQATRRDFSLSDYLNEYPPQMDGLVELRIYFSATGTGVDSSHYPAADIRVSGTTWTLVRGGKVDCTNGSAKSPEDALPSTYKVGLESPQPLSSAAVRAIRAGGGSVDVAATPSAQAVSTEARGVTGGVNHGLLVAGLTAAAAIVAAAALYLRRTRTDRGGNR